MPPLITASTEEVGMDLVPEDRAIARSDEPEARSDARWRERAVADTPDGDRGALAGARVELRRRSVGLCCSGIWAGRRGRWRRTRGRWLTISASAIALASMSVAAGRAEIARLCARSARAAGPAWRERGRAGLGRGVGDRDVAAAGHGRALVLRLPGRGARPRSQPGRRVATGQRTGAPGGVGWSRGWIGCRGSRPTRSGARCSRSPRASRCGTG